MTEWTETVGNSDPVFGGSGVPTQTGLGADQDVIVLDSIQTVTEVQPGSTIPVTASLTNIANWVNFIAEPDYCTRNFFGDGYSVEARLTIGGNLVDSSKFCFPIGSTTQVELSGPAPTTQGDAPVRFSLVTENTSNTVVSEQRTVSVTSRGGGQSCPPGFVRDPDTGECVTGRDNGDNGTEGSGLTGFVVNNPVLAGATGLAGFLLVSSIAETTVEEVIPG